MLLRAAAERANGADEALFVNYRVEVTGVSSVEYRGFLKAGHAAHSRVLDDLEQPPPSSFASPL